MDMFSLEDEDASALFITQESSGISQLDLSKNSENEELFCGVEEGDFSSPCVSMVGAQPKLPQYSDISEDENDFETTEIR